MAAKVDLPGYGSFKPGLGGAKSGSSKNNPIEGLYQKSLEQSAGDYDSIMGQWRNLPNQDLQYSPLGAPQQLGYNENSEFGNALSIYGNMASTGGYSGGDLQNIRERAISPIRSIYGNAMRNLSRQRALQGGYSPSYNATTAKMARDLSTQIGDITTNANAAIAQMVAEGKRAGAAGYAPLATHKMNMLAEIARMNAENTNRVNELNSTRQNETNIFNANRDVQAIQGQQQLYGTTPALANTFGNQVLSMADMISANEPVKSSKGSGAKMMDPIASSISPTTSSYQSPWTIPLPGNTKPWSENVPGRAKMSPSGRRGGLSTAY